MRDASDDEEGFIPSDIEVRNKFTLKLASINATKDVITRRFTTHYRFAYTFIKQEHPKAYQTPFTLPEEPITAVLTHKKQKPSLHYEHPYKTYCLSAEFALLYSRTSREPLTPERQYMNNEVSLLNIEDKQSPSLKELKAYNEEEYLFNGDDLHFDSRFENGNLHCAYRKKETQQYHLFMSNDTNTNGYNQWFYFSVRNMRKKVKYCFRIVNYRKCLEFWRQGQRVALFSLAQVQHTSSGWSRAGDKFSFEESNIRSYAQRKQFILSFQLQFQHENDYVLLASSIPYSYSKLIRQLRDIESEIGKSGQIRFQMASAGSTLCNNEVPEVTITGKDSSKGDKQKIVIIIMARQHPGQVWSSYVAEGIMRNLLKSNPEVQYLLDNYIFKIFPMVNIDGVIYGNFRCDVSGVDLNRRWRDPSRTFHPQIFDLKKRISSISKKWRVDLCLDLHGHSKKFNIFCYACKHNSYTCRILPYLIESESPLFYFPSCTFGLSRDKESTARAAISRILKSQNVLTIETSSYGWRSNRVPTQFHPIDLWKFAEGLLRAIRFFVDKKSTRYKSSEENIKQNYSQFQHYDQQNEDESGSDSEPEQDEIDFKVKLSTIIDKKFEHQYKSFAKEDHAPQLHLSQIIFKESPRIPDKIEEIIDNSSDADRHSERDGPIIDFGTVTLQNVRENEKRTNYYAPKSLQRSLEHPQIEHKKNISINLSQIGKDVNALQIKNNKDSKGKMFITKNIAVRERKKISLSGHNKDIKTLNPRNSILEEVDRKSNLFKEMFRDDQRKRIENFVSRFERFIPSTFGQNPRNRLEALEEGLKKQDPNTQLNAMLENKRRVQMERIRRSIQDRTMIAERQGKVKILPRKQPIVDYKRFKQNQKLKLQSKKLGQFSERYIEGKY